MRASSSPICRQRNGTEREERRSGFSASVIALLIARTSVAITQRVVVRTGLYAEVLSLRIRSRVAVESSRLFVDMRIITFNNYLPPT
mgnify:CR=1 FL=1